jgi:hypothetical protein
VVIFASFDISKCTVIENVSKLTEHMTYRDVITTKIFTSANVFFQTK